MGILSFPFACAVHDLSESPRRISLPKEIQYFLLLALYLMLEKRRKMDGFGQTVKIRYNLQIDKETQTVTLQATALLN